MTVRVASRLPGVALLAAVGLAGRAVGAATGVSYLVATVALGVVLGNVVGVPTRFVAGVRTYKLWLETGIVLMGAGIALGEVLAAGPPVLGLVAVVVPGTLLVVEALGRLLGFPRKLGSLLASGASVCGVSAVVSVAGSIDADDAHVAYASGTVLLFDALTLVVYPAVGELLDLSDLAFGVWAGTTMFSTGPVAAAGFAYSQAAGEWATLTKFVRNALIGVVALGYAVWYVRADSESDDGAPASDAARGWRGRATTLWSEFPKFFVGFVVLLVLGNTVLAAPTRRAVANAADWAFLLAFAGLGVELRLDALRDAGWRPFVAVLVSLSVFSTVALAAVTTLF